MSEYKFKAGMSNMDRHTHQRTVHIYKENNPVYFFTSLNPLFSSNILYHICIDIDLYKMYMNPSYQNNLDIYLHQKYDPVHYLDMLLEIIERINTYEDSTAKHFAKILSDIADEMIFKDV